MLMPVNFVFYQTFELNTNGKCNVTSFQRYTAHSKIFSSALSKPNVNVTFSKAFWELE